MDKRIAGGKIKVISINLIAEVGFAIDEFNNTQWHIETHYGLICNQSMPYL
jgi:hypothetical protein